MYIIYYADNGSMGDTSDHDCQKFREWAKDQLTSRYPDHHIQVIRWPSPHQCYTDDFDNEAEIEDFCHRLWDRCPWDWQE